MSEIAIRVDGLSKRYAVGRMLHGSLREQFAELLRFGARARGEDFWALRDLAFEVPRGAALGIVGRNGAGKSTLLKLLSRITHPTQGRIEIHGRVASVLEVGTGFHPELTGRENIFLNGAILGMTRHEIRSRLDEIVAFSGIEQFIDTPVKRYSSGMYVRLAFAVAAHLEPDILIIDEVLAVGDADFQKKCLGKMQKAYSHEGRTILFVSHNMTAVKSLCTSGIVLHKGSIDFLGSAAGAIEHYNGLSAGRSRTYSLERLPRTRGARFIVFRELEFNSDVYFPSSEFEVRLRLKQIVPDIAIQRIHLALFIVDSLGNILYHLGTLFRAEEVRFSEDSVYGFRLDVLGLRAGMYNVWAWLLGNGIEQDFVDLDVSFEVADGNIYGATNSGLVIGAVQREFSFTVTVP
jgi:lipopolysaccharide transport system ATP-binding protein